MSTRSPTTKDLAAHVGHQLAVFVDRAESAGARSRVSLIGVECLTCRQTSEWDGQPIRRVVLEVRP